MTHFDETGNKRCFIIAEIGVNHNGQIEQAKELIDRSKDAGADAVKFQSYKTHLLASRSTPKVRYQELTAIKNESHYEMLKKLELSERSQAELHSYCKNLGITFMSTPYDIESAIFLNEKLDVELFKTASADIVDHALQGYIAKTGKPSIVSIGMADMTEIKQVLSIYKNANNKRLSLLQCTSSYPCDDSELNLGCITSLAKETDVHIGFSDHSSGTLAALLAYGLGARVIEKHVTLNKHMSGPDLSASADMDEFALLVKQIRRAEYMLGKSIKECSRGELQMRSVSRKSAHARRTLKAGEVLSEEDIVFKRPGTGFLGNELSSLIGKELRKDVSEGEILCRGDIDE